MYTGLCEWPDLYQGGQTSVLYRGVKERIHKTIERFIAQHGRSTDAVIPMLQDLQKEFHYLPEEALREVCSLTEITPAQITGVSTFYSQFRHEPAGRNIIRICTGTACHVKGALFVYEAFRRKLDLTEGKDTDP